MLGEEDCHLLGLAPMQSSKLSIQALIEVESFMPHVPVVPSSRAGHRVESPTSVASAGNTAPVAAGPGTA
jgi:hypothetical protein